MQNVEGIEGLIAALDRLQELIPDDWSPCLYDIGDYLQSIVATRFYSSVDADGVPFAPLKKGKRRPLINSGDLLAAMQSAESLEFTETSVVHSIPGDVYYGGVHQKGWGPIPQRAFLGLNEDNQTHIAKIVEEFWVEHIRSALSG